MTGLTKIFEPGRIGKLRLKNRLVMPAMQTRAASSRHFATQSLIDFYEERAKGGIGLIIVQQTFTQKEACLTNGLGLWDDKFIPGLQKLVNHVKKHGTAIAIQLGCRGTMVDRHMKSVAPSALPSAWDGSTPTELSVEEIRQMVSAFAEAGGRAKAAGFDALEIHGAHGHLISQFLSPYTNRRKDEYGGSLKNRCRFACEILRSLKETVGKDFPVIFRMNGSDFIDGGIDIADAKQQAAFLVSAGANALHVSGCTHETIWWHFPSYRFPSAFLVPLAAAIKKVVRVPIITVGKIGDPHFAERILRQHKADFIAMGRALLADPELPRKALQGKRNAINKCIYCMNCLGTSPVSCTVNPALLRERKFRGQSTLNPKKVLVVGGGLAGMKSATILAKRGHRVSIIERASSLGGQWNIASQQKYKSGFVSLAKQIVRNLTREAVEIILNKEATAEWVERGMWDVVVLATGAAPKGLDVPGAEGKNVVQAVDVIQGKVKVGRRVVVVGGRERGMEVAESLALSGREVSLVTRREFGRDTNRLITASLRDSLAEQKVCVYPNSPVLEIRKRSVYVANNRSLLRLEADTVVLAVGSLAQDKLFGQLEGHVRELYAIGDCKEPRNAMHAVNEAAELGFSI